MKQDSGGGIDRRVNVTHRIHRKVWKAIQSLAAANKQSQGSYLEAILIEHAKSKGALPQEFQPLGETRGRKSQANSKQAKETKK